MPLTIVIVASSLYTDIQISKNVPPFPPPFHPPFPPRFPPRFPPSQAWTECESDAVPCELQWLEGEEGESADCESDAAPCELQWLESEEGESGFCGK
jgi:hypothetical protein